MVSAWDLEVGGEQLISPVASSPPPVVSKVGSNLHTNEQRECRERASARRAVPLAQARCFACGGV